MRETQEVDILESNEKYVRQGSTEKDAKARNFVWFTDIIQAHSTWLIRGA